ncbi:MAG: efflux transporter outer membrane subunit [Acidovorax sp.]
MKPLFLLAPTAAVCAALLAACSTQPAYQRPALDVPAAYKEGVEGSGVWQTAQPADAVPDDWWTLFNDATLNALQQQAAASNQNIAQSVANLRSAMASVQSSRAALWPTLGLNAGATRSRSNSAVTANGTVNTSSYETSTFTTGLSASWEPDLWGKLSGAVDSARLAAQASADDLAALRLSVQSTVAQTYFSLRAGDVQTRLLRETLAAYQRSWDMTRNRYAAGVASSADVAQAESQYKSAQSQLIEAETSRAQLEHALAALVGQPPAAFTLPPLAESADLPAPPPVPAQLPSRLLERRPDIAAAERRVAAANAQVGVAKAAYFPDLTLSASAGYRSTALSNLFKAPYLVWSVGPALAASLFDGGARSAAVESARAAQDQATATYRQTVITALQEVEDNLVAGAALEREQAVQQEAVAAAQRALEVTLNQYRAGTVAYLNVLSAQATALSAQSSLISVRNRRLAATATLLKNVAGRWEAWDAPHESAR